jgi:transcriptional regulator with XRE-family HTH domain
MVKGIGNRIYQLRTEKGLTMDMIVADMNQKYELQLNKSMFSRWEKEQTNPSLESAKFLCDYFDVSLDYLIGLTEVRTPTRLLAYATKLKAKEGKQ